MRKVQLPVEGLKINLGCGPRPHRDFIGIDFIDFEQDIVWDITDGIPLPDNSVDEIFSSHFVEHIAEGDMDTLIKEIIRVCKIGAVVNIKCPHSDCDETYYLSHLTRWNESRVRGIVKGVNRWKDSKKLKIDAIKIVGIEIKFRLIVC